eukprot:1259041-Rhodomonas_salina.2
MPQSASWKLKAEWRRSLIPVNFTSQPQLLWHAVDQCPQVPLQLLSVLTPPPTVTLRPVITSEHGV